MIEGTVKNKPKVMLHFVKPGATGGPNVLYRRIQNTLLLSEKYDFIPLNQDRVAGGKINIRLILELKRLIEKERPDIIAISGMQSAGFHCMVAAVLAGCKNRVITTHGFSGDSLGLSAIKRFVFSYIIEPITLIMATRVQGISKFTTQRSMVMRYARYKTCYIYNFPPNINEIFNMNYVRDNLGISCEEIVFTTVSRIVLDKGYIELAEAIRRLSNINNVRFLIVGDGEYEDVFREDVKEEIKKGKVIMLGKRSDVMNILLESSVFVLPTLHENLGNVFLEASLASIPSIGTNVGGVPEIIVDGETGLLVPPFDSKALADAILKLFIDSNLRKEMGQKAYNRLKTVFNSDEIAKKFDELFSSMLGKKGEK